MNSITIQYNEKIITIALNKRITKEEFLNFIKNTFRIKQNIMGFQDENGKIIINSLKNRNYIRYKLLY